MNTTELTLLLAKILNQKPAGFFGEPDDPIPNDLIPIDSETQAAWLNGTEQQQQTAMFASWLARSIVAAQATE